MARSAPVPDIPPIPGMCPSIAVLAGGGDGGDGSGEDAGDGSGDDNAGGDNSADQAAGDGRGPPDFQRYPECGYASHPVDVVTGRAFTHPAIDLQLPGPLPLVFERMYSSKMSNRDTGLGYGWGHTFGWEIEVARRKISVWNQQGVAVEFPAIPVGGEAIGPWGWVIRREAWGFVVDANDGLWHVFSQPFEEGRRYRLTAVEDRNKNRITIVYDDNKLVEIQDSAGRTVRVKSTPDGHIASLEVLNAVQNGRWVAFARYLYDDRGDLVAATDADGHTARFAYDDRHLLVSDTDRVGLCFHFVYDEKGRCVESWGDYPGRRDPSLVEGLPRYLADGHTRVKGIHHCRFTFLDDGYSEVADSTQVRRYFGNKDGLINKKVEAGGVQTNAYDDKGFLLARTNALKATTTFERDARGRILRVSEPLGRVTSLRRDAAGLEIEIVDPKGGITAFQRDRFGNILAITNAVGAVTTVRYDGRGQPLEVVDGTGGKGLMEYDAHGNIVSITQPNGGVFRYTYDAFGRRTGTLDPLGATRRNVYSDRGDLVAVYDGLGGVTRYEYDGEGHLTREVSPSGAATDYLWGGYHKVVTKRDTNGHTVELRYNLEGELVLVKNARGEEHRLERDAFGRLVGETMFDGRSYSYKLDALDQVVRVASAAGEKTELVYNEVGELIEKMYSDDRKESFAYDSFGELIEAMGPTGTFRFERDALGRIVRETQLVSGEEHSVEIEYDLMDRRTARRTSLGHAEAIARDAAGSRRKTLLDGAFEIQHTPDALGREVERRLPGGGRINSAFDAEGRLARRAAMAPTAHAPRGAGEPEWLGTRYDGVTADRSYRYDWDGELIEVLDAQRGSTRYEYDPVGQLVAMVPPKARALVFRHDPAGNLHEGEGGAERVYEHGRLARIGHTTYHWDGEGRLSEKRTRDPKTLSESSFHYTWDASGMLRKVESPSGEIIEFAYDPLARRVEKKISRKAAPGRKPIFVSKTRFVWDSDVLVHEIKKSAREGGDPVVEERTYCFEDSSFEPAAHREGSNWLAYMNDPAGAPDRLIAADGSVAAEIERAPWGRGKAAPGNRASTPIGLQGQYEDAETGLAYNRFRYYDPDAARFIAPDPLGLQGGVHPYKYASNVQSWVDPLGLVPGAPVLLGQTMSTRVTPTAAAHGHHTFQVRSRFQRGDAGAEHAWEKNQRRWMRDQVDSGRRIYDIGDDPRRSDRSRFCAIEHEVLREEGFTRVCTGTTIMVDGTPTAVHEWVPPPGFQPGDGRRRRMAARRS
jgi:RHS repeat-associated protein